MNLFKFISVAVVVGGFVVCDVVFASAALPDSQSIELDQNGNGIVTGANSSDAVVCSKMNDAEEECKAFRSADEVVAVNTVAVVQRKVAFIYTMYDPQSNGYYQVCYDDNWDDIECSSL